MQRDPARRSASKARVERADRGRGRRAVPDEEIRDALGYLVALARGRETHASDAHEKLWRAVVKAVATHRADTPDVIARASDGAGLIRRRHLRPALAAAELEDLIRSRASLEAMSDRLAEHGLRVSVNSLRQELSDAGERVDDGARKLAAHIVAGVTGNENVIRAAMRLHDSARDEIERQRAARAAWTASQLARIADLPIESRAAFREIVDQIDRAMFFDSIGSEAHSMLGRLEHELVLASLEDGDREKAAQDLRRYQRRTGSRSRETSARAHRGARDPR